MALASAARTRLEKAAADNGFDLDRSSVGEWLAFGSSGAPLRIWLSAWADGVLVAALSQPNVLTGLAHHGFAVSNPLPPGAYGARAVTDFEALHQLLRRAWALSRTLPDELLHVFQARTATLPRTTEAERLVIQRVGQDVFRAGLLEYWDGRCAVTGLDVPELLRASHIKPWADCETDAERLDVFNGLLLAPHLDAAFDKGFITFADDGRVRVSDALAPEARDILGLVGPIPPVRLNENHRPYLAWHRAHVLKATAAEGEAAP